MKFKTLIKTLFVSSVLALSLTHYPLEASLSDYIKDFPWMGLISNEITYGPITVSSVNINGDDKFAIVTPGELIHGTLKYKVDSSKEKFHLHHLIVGIEGVGAQDCVMHNLGLKDTKGKGKFTLTAPNERGIYEVRFLYNEGLTCGGARDAWNSGVKDPSASATIGVIIVE